MASLVYPIRTGCKYNIGDVPRLRNNRMAVRSVFYSQLKFEGGVSAKCEIGSPNLPQKILCLSPILAVKDSSPPTPTPMSSPIISSAASILSIEVFSLTCLALLFRAIRSHSESIESRLFSCIQFIDSKVSPVLPNMDLTSILVFYSLSPVVRNHALSIGCSILLATALRIVRSNFKDKIYSSVHSITKISQWGNIFKWKRENQYLTPEVLDKLKANLIRWSSGLSAIAGNSALYLGCLLLLVAAVNSVLKGKPSSSIDSTSEWDWETKWLTPFKELWDKLSPYLISTVLIRCNSALKTKENITARIGETDVTGIVEKSDFLSTTVKKLDGDSVKIPSELISKAMVTVNDKQYVKISRVYKFPFTDTQMIIVAKRKITQILERHYPPKNVPEKAPNTADVPERNAPVIYICGEKKVFVGTKDIDHKNNATELLVTYYLKVDENYEEVLEFQDEVSTEIYRLFGRLAKIIFK